MCIYCNTMTMHRASESMCGECVWASKWAAQLKTILNFLDSEHILYNYQLGFRKNRSTQMALSILVDRIQQCISKNQYVIGTFIDLSKAFDLVNHKILLKKLYHYGIRGHALEWINNYLTDRTQYVVYNNGTSHHGTVSMGVPQGSILGPLLF